MGVWVFGGYFRCDEKVRDEESERRGNEELRKRGANVLRVGCTWGVAGPTSDPPTSDPPTSDPPTSDPPTRPSTHTPIHPHAQTVT